MVLHEGDVEKVCSSLFDDNRVSSPSDPSSPEDSQSHAWKHREDDAFGSLHSDGTEVDVDSGALFLLDPVIASVNGARHAAVTAAASKHDLCCSGHVLQWPSQACCPAAPGVAPSHKSSSLQENSGTEMIMKAIPCLPHNIYPR